MNLKLCSTLDPLHVFQLPHIKPGFLCSTHTHTHTHTYTHTHTLVRRPHTHTHTLTKLHTDTVLESSWILLLPVPLQLFVCSCRCSGPGFSGLLWNFLLNFSAAFFLCGAEDQSSGDQAPFPVHFLRLNSRQTLECVCRIFSFISDSDPSRFNVTRS